MHPTTITSVFISLMAISSLTGFEAGMAICFCVIMFSSTETFLLIPTGKPPNRLQRASLSIERWRTDQPNIHQPYGFNFDDDIT